MEATTKNMRCVRFNSTKSFLENVYKLREKSPKITFDKWDFK